MLYNSFRAAFAVLLADSLQQQETRQRSDNN